MVKKLKQLFELFECLTISWNWRLKCYAIKRLTVGDRSIQIALIGHLITQIGYLN